MKKLLPALLLLAVPLHAQKTPVYGCRVLSVDSDVVIYSISTDGVFSQKQSAPHPVNETDGIKDLCRKEIARLTAKDTQPIVLGDVDLSVTPPPPPAGVVDPDLVAFQLKVRKARSLVGISSTILASLIADIDKALEAHPEYLDSI